MEEVNLALFTTPRTGIYNHNDTLAEYHSDSPPPSHGGNPNALRILFSASNILTFIFGFSGNLLVLLVIGYYRNVRQKSVANYYIWNLSLADLLFTLTIPFFFYTFHKKDWPFGIVMCKMGFVLRETNRFSSIFTLVALSFDRFIASFYNLAQWRTIRVGIYTCITIWVLCGLLASPYLLYAQTLTDHEFARNNQTLERTGTKCYFRWPGDDPLSMQIFWTYFQLLIGLIIPFIIIFISYVMLASRLHRLTKNGQPSMVKKPSRKTTKTVVIVVLIFLICQTPYYVLEIWSLRQRQHAREPNFIPSTLQRELFPYVNTIVNVLVFISSCCNPVLYGLMNENYRNLYRVVLCRAHCRPVKSGQGEEVERPSSDSNAASSSSAITYRFQITFHKPCSKASRSRCRRKRSVPTENIIMLSERATTEISPTKHKPTPSSEKEPLEKESVENGGGVHLGLE